MDFFPFPAQLCAAYNNTCEYGQGFISPHDNAIDFVGDFVPLMPLGAEATITWVLGEERLASFTGSVYLSSPTLTRLVGISPAALARARGTLASNTGIPAVVAAGAAGQKNPSDLDPRIPCEIIYLTLNRMTLRAPGPFAKGQALWLSAEVDFLTLRDQPLVVERRVALRRDDALLLCDVPPGGDDNFIALSTYAARLAEAETRQP